MENAATTAFRIRNPIPSFALASIGVILCIMPALAQRPGDRIFPNEMNPAYSIVNLLPTGFKPQVTGMDSLSDGTLVLSTREDGQGVVAPPASGKIYLVSGYAKYSAANVSYKIIAEGLFEPMGVAVVHDTIYAITQNELIQFSDPGGKKDYASKKTVCKGWPYSGDPFEWAFGLVYKDGSFYTQLSSSSIPEGDYQSNNRGTVLRMRIDNTFEFLSTGIRRGNGIGLGPDNDVFVTNNQGEWSPTNSLIHVQKGKWFGYHNGPHYNPENLPVSKPVIWMEWYPVSRSPSQPSLLIQGPYRGQMITGDCTDPNIRRMFLEKVNNEYQGAVFHFAAMDKAPANRFLMRANGDVVVGGLASYLQSDWNWAGGVIYGLQVLRPSGVTPFDILAVRAVKGGFDIEFTKPVGSGAENAGNYEVKSWGYIYERRYDSQKQNEYQISPGSVKLSSDRKRVFLALDNLKEGNVVYIRLKEGIQSQTNESPWVTEAWYTLNSFGTALPLGPVSDPWVPTAMSGNDRSFQSSSTIAFNPVTRMLIFRGEGIRNASVVIHDMRGRIRMSLEIVDGANGLLLPESRFPTGIYRVEIKSRGLQRNQAVAIF